MSEVSSRRFSEKSPDACLESGRIFLAETFVQVADSSTTRNEIGRGHRRGLVPRCDEELGVMHDSKTDGSTLEKLVHLLATAVDVDADDHESLGSVFLVKRL